MKVRLLAIHTNTTPIARVVCEEDVNLHEEDKLRKMFDRFYARTKHDFSRVAIQVLGSVILFRVVPNCKRPPNDEDMAVILRAMNLECEPAPKPIRKKRNRLNQATRHGARAI